MLSKASFEKIKNKRDMKIQTTKMKVFVADGNQLALEGKVDIEIEIGRHILNVAAMVADIQVDGILGLDVITESVEYLDKPVWAIANTDITKETSHLGLGKVKMCEVWTQERRGDKVDRAVAGDGELCLARIKVKEDNRRLGEHLVGQPLGEGGLANPLPPGHYHPRSLTIVEGPLNTLHRQLPVPTHLKQTRLAEAP